MYQFILLVFNAAIDFNGFWSRVTLLDITIIAFLIVFLIIAAVNNKKHRKLNLDEIKYRFISKIFNAIICFIGFFVNEFAFIQIFGDPGGYWGGGTIGTILFGITMLLIISLINITVNMKIYRHWNPNGSYKSIKFWIPICAYILFDVLLPLHELF